MTTIAPHSDDTVIGQVITKFCAGDFSLFDHIATDIDFRIDHFRDATDVNWQQATSRADLALVFERLATEVFPKGTRAIDIATTALGQGWHLTRFHQEFFYGVRQCDVTSQTYIISHEAAGQLDYFRETVTTVDNK